MKRTIIKRLLGTGLSLCSLALLMPQGAMAAWKQNSTGYWYSEGNSWAVGWRYIDGCWYYFNSDGYMKTSSWIETNGKWYFVSDTGSMLRSTTVDGYVLGADGAWIKDGSNSSSNSAGWKQNSTGWWYLNENGSYATNWKSFDTDQSYIEDGQSIPIKTWYYFGYDGYMKTGWQQISGKWYYFKASGEMAADENIGGYILGRDGAMIDDLFVKKEDGGFTLKILNKENILDKNEVELCIVNNTGKTSSEYWLPNEPGPYWVEKYVDGKWTLLHYKSVYDNMSVMEDYVNTADIKTINMQTVKLSKFEGFNASEQGKYRICFKSSDSSNEKYDTAYAEFEINPLPGLV